MPELMDVWHILPNEGGEGGETWAAFAADLDMIRMDLEARLAALRKLAEPVLLA